ncbi:Mo-dependent nitrogenase C-terminal domain-containing protein [Leptolyngbya sp. AN02str]|uniref:Mo-dependent nitrogenase C-terminal domain-containing protein n=1 Tax=Leptolyngbya sp. AN02str TaxID=3423363 RepID=UPI003D317FCE
MTETIRSPYSEEQVSVWLQGLLAIAWADGHFDEPEKAMIASLTELELAPQLDLNTRSTVTPQDVVRVLGADPHASENFLRTAVMVAIADGVYSPDEDALLHQYCTGLGMKADILDSLRATLAQVRSATETGMSAPAGNSQGFDAPAEHYVPVLAPVQEWLDGLEIHDPRLARFLCKMIPPQCPFERDVVLFGKKVVHIPAMCKLNPLYEQLVGLRFRSLSYLADECGEDVSPYV